VTGENLSVPVRLAEDAYRTEYVVNLLDDGTLFGDGSEMLDIERAAQRFYELFEDEYDFLVIRSSHSLLNVLNGFNRPVHNDVEGIGLDLFNFADLYGSAGRLKNVLFINFWLLGPFIHELAHTWANLLSPFNTESYGAHWGLANVGGVLGGTETFEAQDDGRYRVPEIAFPRTGVGVTPRSNSISWD